MTKIEALEGTVYNLENDLVVYNWESSESCNCGVVSRTVVSCNENETLWDDYGFKDSPKKNYKVSPFSDYAWCLKSNLPLPKVFSALADAGFSYEDLFHLENLNDPIILSRFDDAPTFCEMRYGNVNHNRSNKIYLIKYLKAWVEILKEKLNSEQSVQVSDTTESAQGTGAGKQIIYRVVEAPSSLLSQSKELIQS